MFCPCNTIQIGESHIRPSLLHYGPTVEGNSRYPCKAFESLLLLLLCAAGVKARTSSPILQWSVLDSSSDLLFQKKWRRSWKTKAPAIALHFLSSSFMNSLWKQRGSCRLTLAGYLERVGALPFHGVPLFSCRFYLPHDLVLHRFQRPLQWRKRFIVEVVITVIWYGSSAFHLGRWPLSTVLELILSGDLLAYYAEMQLYNTPFTYIEQESSLAAIHLANSLHLFFFPQYLQLSCVQFLHLRPCSHICSCNVGCPFWWYLTQSTYS